MERFEATVRATVEQYHMLDPGDRVIAAVSGGADSVCLLVLLAEMRTSLHLQLRAVHVHHGLREGEADRDAEFVEKLCSALNVPCHMIRVDVRRQAKERGMSEEEAGRCLRYEAFEKEATAWEREENLGLVRVAVAHHGDDQAETILHNLFRGSGLIGLRGIPYVRGRVIRPLLDRKREEILRWLSDRDLSFVEDSTNRENHYTRNRIRNRLIPQIEKEVNPGAVGNILRLGRLAEQADGYLREQAILWVNGYVKRVDLLPDPFPQMKEGESLEGEQAIPAVEEDGEKRGVWIPAREFRSQPEIICSYILLELLKELSHQSKDIGECHVQQVMGLFSRSVGRKVNLPYGLIARREYEGVWLGLELPREELPSSLLPRVETEIFSYEKGMEIPKKMYTKWFDCDKIKGMPMVRTRQTGDFITLSDGSRKTVKRFMIDEKIPREKRDEIALLADENHVMWILGYRISQFYKIGTDTKRVFEVRVICPAEERNNHDGG